MGTTESCCKKDGHVPVSDFKEIIHGTSTSPSSLKDVTWEHRRDRVGWSAAFGMRAVSILAHAEKREPFPQGFWVISFLLAQSFGEVRSVPQWEMADVPLLSQDVIFLLFSFAIRNRSRYHRFPRSSGTTVGMHMYVHDNSM